MKTNYSSEKTLPRFAIKFANMVFVLGILFSILLIVYATYKIYNPPEPVSPVFYIFSILFGVVFAAFFGFGLKRLSNDLKVNLSVLFLTIGIVVYGFEAYLDFFKKNQTEIIAKQKGISYDTRTKREVLEDLRNSGVEAYPNIDPGQRLAENNVIYNLGTISNVTTILGNESGYYPIIETDEHGFNNPKGLYVKNKVDIVLTGDSFTEGFSVHSDENISAVLRQFDLNVISVGKAGNGPLLELAALKEYAEPLKPKIVLWLYYVNDIHNLNEIEMKSLILRKYLNDVNYSQNLIYRQEEIDDLLINYSNQQWKKELGMQKIIYFLKLNELRRLINLMPAPTLTYTPVFKDILSKSKHMVSDWGGKMYFIYLPSFYKYSMGKEKYKYRDFVLRTATELDLPIIDIHKEVFELHPDPLSLFPLRIKNHYNAKGYKFVAEAIRKRLEADGYIPIKSRK